MAKELEEQVFTLLMMITIIIIIIIIIILSRLLHLRLLKGRRII